MTWFQILLWTYFSTFTLTLWQQANRLTNTEINHKKRSCSNLNFFNDWKTYFLICISVLWHICAFRYFFHINSVSLSSAHIISSWESLFYLNHVVQHITGWKRNVKHYLVNETCICQLDIIKTTVSYVYQITADEFFTQPK